MTRETDALVERVARAICLSYGQDPDETAPTGTICGPNNEPRFMWEAYAEQACAAIAVLSDQPVAPVQALEWLAAANALDAAFSHIDESTELPDDLRAPLHSLQADIDWLVARIRAEDDEVVSMCKDSIRSRLSQIEEASYRLFAARPLIPEAQGVATHRHKERGTEYVLLGLGKMQARRWFEGFWDEDCQVHAGSTVDKNEVAVYRSVDDGSLWVRPREEFEDGRFEVLASSPTYPADPICRQCASGEPGIPENCTCELATTTEAVEAQGDGWIPHDGSECPVAEDCLVRVRLRDGLDSETDAKGCSFDWQHQPNDPAQDIIAYRLTPQARRALRWRC